LLQHSILANLAEPSKKLDLAECPMKRIRDAFDAEEEARAKDAESLASRQEGPFDHLVEECFLESYHSILRMCESNNVLCPYFSDFGMPIFKESVLREMDTKKGYSVCSRNIVVRLGFSLSGC